MPKLLCVPETLCNQLALADELFGVVWNHKSVTSMHFGNDKLLLLHSDLKFQL